MTHYVVSALYFDSIRELQKINRSRLRIAERVALEKALAKLEAMKMIINSCNLQVKTQ